MTRNRDATRRSVLKTGGALAAGALLAGCTGGGSASPDSGGSSGGGSSGSGSGSDSSGGSADGAGGADFGGWFDSVSNYDGVVDETGASEATVAVGVAGNNGSNGFGPAALRVDSGTTVVWEWTGQGSSHNVVAEDGSFESDYHSNQGATFEHTFSESGTYKYVCVPHEQMGMKGAVVVE